jgi:GNAT superfamily N-acetyltransferase
LWNDHPIGETGGPLRIATIHIEAWRVAYRGIIPDEFLRSLSIEQRHAAWQQALEAGHPFTWVAEEGDVALGWISAAASRDVDAGQSTGEIWAVYIDPSHWGEGIGRAPFVMPPSRNYGNRNSPK